MNAAPTERPASPYLPVYAALGLAGGVWLGERALGAGLWACANTSLSPAPGWWLAPLPLLLAVMVWGRQRRRMLIPAMIALCVCLGGWRYMARPFAPCLGPEDLASYHSDTPFGRPGTLEGVIVGYPDRRMDYAQYRVQVDTYWQGETVRAVQGMALVRTDLDPAFAYGDRVRIRGVIAAPPVFPDFDYRRFLARQGIHTLIRSAEVTLLKNDQGQYFWSALYDLRQRGSTVLSDVLPPPFSSLANGMILGIESGIPRDLYDEFNLTGTSHVIVISGSNIAIISGIFLGLSNRLFRRRGMAVTATLLGIAIYVLLVGADASVTRAGIMGGLYVIGAGLGRRSSALISLFVAAFLMLLANPLALWDVGFQLSFMATLGLAIFGQPLRRRWQQSKLSRRLPRPLNTALAEGLLVTLAAQIMTLPLVVHLFGRLSLISFLVNVLILPVQPAILIVGGLTTLVGLALLPLARLLALVPQAALWWTVFVVQRAAALPWASLEINAFGRMLAGLYYLVLALGFLWWLLRQEQSAPLLPPAWRPVLARSAALAGLFILPFWAGSAWQESQPDGRLHLTLLGRETAAAFLIVTPGGNRVLLDPGREAAAYPLDSLLTSLPGGSRHLDLVILTRPAAVAPDLRLPPDRMLRAQDPALQPGTTLALDEGVTLDLLHTPNEAGDSLLFLLRYGEFSVLLPFENTQASQQAVRDRLPASVTLLVAPFPGTGAWPHPDLLARLRIQLALLPHGATYPPGVQRALAAFTTAALPTGAAVEISTDGRTFTLLHRPYAADVVER